MRKVVCAALQFGSPAWPANVLVLGPRHFDHVMQRQGLEEKIAEYGKPAQGFIDQQGMFMTRAEAMVVAKDAGQVPKTNISKILFSEDLY